MIGWIILAVVVLLLAVPVVRALRFRPLPVKKPEPLEQPFDGDRAVESLARMIRCRTVSRDDPALADEAEFERFRALLRELYPTVFEKAEYSIFGRCGVMLRLRGQTEGGPSVFMAHYDVVPPVEEAWEHPPFCGEVIDGELWGRGALDTKITLCAMLEAAENLLQRGFVPKNDMIFAFGGDEETMGTCAAAAVEEFKAQGIVPSFVLDEGGAVVENVFPGVRERCALIGTAEKGALNAEFVLEGSGGHASTPPAHSHIGRLAEVVRRVEGNPFPAQLCRPIAEMFDTLGRRSTFVYRLIFANIRLFMPLLGSIYKKQGGELNAMLRTTVAFTQMQGSAAHNVMPPRASVLANLRLLGEDTVESALARLRRVAGDGNVTVSAVDMRMDPSPISHTDCEQWEQLKTAVARTWPDAVISPYLMLQCSDSRYYSRISPYVYRFSAMALTREQRGLIHNNNERVPVNTVHEAVRFYLNLLSLR